MLDSVNPNLLRNSRTEASSINILWVLGIANFWIWNVVECTGIMWEWNGCQPSRARENLVRSITITKGQNAAPHDSPLQSSPLQMHNHLINLSLDKTALMM